MNRYSQCSNTENMKCQFIIILYTYYLITYNHVYFKVFTECFGRNFELFLY